MAKKIEKVKDNKSGIESNVYLDTKEMMFSAEFADFRMRDKDGDKVRAALLAAIRERAELVWTPVIRVEQAYNNSYNNEWGTVHKEHRENMGLHIERFFVARKMDGSWVQIDWYTEPQHRMINAKSWYGDQPRGATEIQYSSVIGEQWFDKKKIEGKFIMPYSDELWDGLIEVLVKMKMIRELVSGLLGSEEGMQKLIEVGSGKALLLGTGETNETPPAGGN